MPSPTTFPPQPDGHATPRPRRSAHTARPTAGLRRPVRSANCHPPVLLGLTSAMGLLLVYSLNTWLPELMLRAGFNAKGSLAFLLVLNGGAVLGALFGSRFADRFGPKLVTAAFLLTGAVFIALLSRACRRVLLLFVALAGLGTSGTQILLFGFVANYYRTNVRAAAVAWCAGFGRMGGIGGPLIGGILIGAGFAVTQIFLILTGVALLGLVLVLMVPRHHRHAVPLTISPSAPVDRIDFVAPS